MGHGANAIVLGRVVRRTRDFVGHVQEVGPYPSCYLFYQGCFLIFQCG